LLYECQDVARLAEAFQAVAAACSPATGARQRKILLLEGQQEAARGQLPAIEEERRKTSLSIRRMQAELVTVNVETTAAAREVRAKDDQEILARYEQKLVQATAAHTDSARRLAACEGAIADQDAREAEATTELDGATEKAARMIETHKLTHLEEERQIAEDIKNRNKIKDEMREKGWSTDPTEQAGIRDAVSKAEAGPKDLLAEEKTVCGLLE